jgi:pimeloyl-ACP methyl ester carboxylesterase
MSVRVLASLASAAVAVLVLVCVVSLGSAATLRSCPGLPAPWRCAVVTVPLDRGGSVGGDVHLAVAEYHRPGPPRPAVLALAGGPGSAAIPGAEGFRARLAPLLGNRDLLVIDQRGTGVSDPISCESIDADPSWTPADVAECAASLGPRRAFYSTRDSVADLEAVRAVLRIPRLTLFGVSYGTKVAADYARTYPARVSGLVLDSVIVEDTDPYYRRSAHGAVRVLRNQCTQGRCTPGHDPVRDLRKVLRREPRLPQAPLLHAVVAGGDLLHALPSALAAAAGGDLGPLTAMLPRTIPDARAPGWLDPSGSRTLYLATSCEDGRFPWQPGASVDARLRAARRDLRRLGDRAFAPFGRAVGRQYGSAALCARWPEAGRTPPPAPLPDVPALLLQGGDDDLAPLGGAREIARELPQSRLVVLPGAGHGVLAASGPTAAALRSFAARLG